MIELIKKQYLIRHFLKLIRDGERRQQSAWPIVGVLGESGHENQRHHRDGDRRIERVLVVHVLYLEKDQLKTFLFLKNGKILRRFYGAFESALKAP